MPDNYIFSLNNFQIFNTMAAHLDTDFVYFTLKVGDQAFGPQHAKIGDLNNGTYKLNWEFGPIHVDDNTPVLLTYQIVNHGHDDAQKQIDDDIKIASAITKGVTTITGAVFPPAAVVIGVIGGALTALGDALGWLFNGINCDGIVLSDAISTDGKEIRKWMNPAGIHTEIRNYTGPNTPWGCGSNAQYAVSWSITPSYVEIASRSSGLVLDVPEASMQDQTQIQQFPVNHGANQRWRLRVVEGKYVVITSLNSGKVLDVPNLSRDPGVQIQQSSLNNGLNQQWELEPSEDNQSIYIISRNSGLVLDVPGFANNPGVLIQQFPINHGWNQKWQMIPDPVDP
ncbi:RICIN domain-containing protein [Nostoc punctiforme UO1]|uniref:RICIN domain-containing protein n=1 Tax=Nostoc punctiforme TaxID=272131 RepID=UPI00309B02E1